MKKLMQQWNWAVMGFFTRSERRGCRASQWQCQQATEINGGRGPEHTGRGGGGGAWQPWARTAKRWEDWAPGSRLRLALGKGQGGHEGDRKLQAGQSKPTEDKRGARGLRHRNSRGSGSSSCDGSSPSPALPVGLHTASRTLHTVSRWSL